MENISGKIIEFSLGHILNNGTSIVYDATFHNDLSTMLSGYYTPDIQYYSQFINDSDLTAAPTNSLSAFNIDAYVLTSGDLETMLGISFEFDYGISGSYVSGFVASLTATMRNITGALASSVSGVSAPLVYVPTVPSEGKTELIRINQTYLDNNDVKTLYEDNLDIIFRAAKIYPNDIIKGIIIKEILTKSKYCSTRMTTCLNDNKLFSKLPDKFISDIVIPNLVITGLSYNQRQAAARCLNSIMPSDADISLAHSNYNLIYTANSLVNEIDVIINALRRKGYDV